MTKKQGSGIVAVFGGGVVELANYYPTFRASVDALKAAGGTGGLMADLFLSPLFGLMLIVMGFLWLWGKPKDTESVEREPAPSGPMLGGSVSGSGNSRSDAAGGAGGDAKAVGNKVDIHIHGREPIIKGEDSSTLAFIKKADEMGYRLVPKEPEPEPDISLSPFDGERCGFEVRNRGGACKLRTRIQILEVHGQASREWTRRDRFPGVWDHYHSDKDAPFNRDFADHLTVARYATHSTWSGGAMYRVEVGNEAQVWRVEDYGPIPIEFIIEVEVEAFPGGVVHKARHLIEADHETGTLSFGRVLG